jgi:hypothetical protein
MRFGGFLTALSVVISAAVPGAVQAQDTQDEGMTAEEAAEEAEATVSAVEDLFSAETVFYQFTITPARFIVTPSFLLDGFFDLHGSHEFGGNLSHGAEFVIRRPEEFDLVFSLDYADISTEDDWWLEADEEIVDTDWGENNLALFTADVAINWTVPIQYGWDFYYGVGLGVAFPLGDFLKTDVDPNCITEIGEDPFSSKDESLIVDNCFDENGDERLEAGGLPEEEDRIPPLLPALSFMVGSRWIIDEQVAIDLEFGWKTIYLYTGIEIGYIWE